MEEYRKKVKRQLTALVVSTILAIAAVALIMLLAFSAENENGMYLDGFVKGYSGGILFGFVIIMCVVIIKRIRALRDDDRLKKMYIAESDERGKLIREKAGGTGYNIGLGILAVAMAASAFLNTTVSLTLGAALLVLAMIKGGFKLYYMKNM